MQLTEKETQLVRRLLHIRYYDEHRYLEVRPDAGISDAWLRNVMTDEEIATFLDKFDPAEEDVANGGKVRYEEIIRVNDERIQGGGT